MPKLDEAMAGDVENAANPNALMDDGIYLARLTGRVEVYDGGKTPVWNWPLTIEPGQPYAGRKLTHKTWISEAAYFRLKDTFAAFGANPATDTDELEGKLVRVKVGQEENYKKDIDDETGLIKMVNDVKELLVAEGPTGINEAMKSG